MNAGGGEIVGKKGREKKGRGREPLPLQTMRHHVREILESTLVFALQAAYCAHQLHHKVVNVAQTRERVRLILTESVL